MCAVSVEGVIPHFATQCITSRHFGHDRAKNGLKVSSRDDTLRQFEAVVGVAPRTVDEWESGSISSFIFEITYIPPPTLTLSV